MRTASAVMPIYLLGSLRFFADGRTTPSTSGDADRRSAPGDSVMPIAESSGVPAAAVQGRVA
jgi:hypothetical protein